MPFTGRTCFFQIALFPLKSAFLRLKSALFSLKSALFFEKRPFTKRNLFFFKLLFFRWKVPFLTLKSALFYKRWKVPFFFEKCPFLWGWKMPFCLRNICRPKFKEKGTFQGKKVNFFSPLKKRELFREIGHFSAKVFVSA